jgi:hypothetical protein
MKIYEIHHTFYAFWSNFVGMVEATWLMLGTKTTRCDLHDASTTMEESESLLPSQIYLCRSIKYDSDYINLD